jgi:glycosyltransferase involved in cell wall biosynthesis
MRRTPSATIHQCFRGVKIGSHLAADREAAPRGLQLTPMGRDAEAAQSDRWRILMIAPTSFFADYGCHVRILEEVRALTSRGHVVRICSYHNGDDVPGVDIHRSVDVPWLKRAEVGSSRHKAYLDVALFIESMRQAIAFKPDVIHGHLHEGALIGSVIGRILRKPVVFDYQGSLTEEMLDHGFIRQRGKREALFRFIERRIDHLPAAIVPSGIAAFEHLKRSAASPDRVTLIHDGVNTRQFDPDAYYDARRDTRARLGIPCDAPVVMYLGLLAEYQGTPLLIDAVRILLARRPDVFVVIAGYPGAEYYAGLAKDMPVDGHVLFPGRVPYHQAAALLAAGDVAVAPKMSATEGNGKLFNYMAMQLPTVAIDTPTNRAILGELGHLVPANDPAALAAAIEVALSDSDHERVALRQRILEQFSWDDRVVDLERVYHRILHRADRSTKQQPSGA